MSGWPAVTCATPNRTCASTWSNPSPWSARKINLSRNRQAQKHVGPRPLDRLVGPSAVRRLAMKSRNRKAAQPRTQAAMNFDTPANAPIAVAEKPTPEETGEETAYEQAKQEAAKRGDTLFCNFCWN